MNREAVALGTPVYTIFSGEMGAVDERLIAEGRLRPLRDPARSSWSSARRAAGALNPRDPQLLRDAVLSRRLATGRSGQSARCAPSTPGTRCSPSCSPARSPGCWCRRPSRSRGGSARSTSRRSGACTTSPRRSWAASRSWSRSSAPALIWLPWDAETRSILAGAAVITALGVVDDVFDLPALPKLLGQIGAALIPVVLGDVRVDVTTLPFVGGFELGWLSYPLTVIGIVAVINVINFIDGVDGLASGVCAISAATFAVIAISLDRYEAGVLAAITAGGVARLPAPRLPARLQLHGGHRLEPARLPARDDRGPGLVEDERGAGAGAAAGRARGPDPRHQLRRRQAAQVPPADLPGRPLALPPPDGEHRLLAAAHARLPLRLDAGRSPGSRWRCASSPTATTAATSTRSGRW